MTHEGNGDDLRLVENSSTNAHYSPDGLMLICQHDLENYFWTKYKYWFTNSLLMRSFVYIDKETFVFKLPSKDEFVAPKVKIKLSVFGQFKFLHL